MSVSRALFMLNYAGVGDLEPDDSYLLQLQAASLYQECKLVGRAAAVWEDLRVFSKNPLIQAAASLRLGIVQKQKGDDAKALAFVQEAMRLSLTAEVVTNQMQLLSLKDGYAAQAFCVIDAQERWAHGEALRIMRGMRSVEIGQGWMLTDYDWDARRLQYERICSAFFLIGVPIGIGALLVFIASLVLFKNFRHKVGAFIGQLESDDVLCIFVMLCTLHMILVLFTIICVLPRGYFNYLYFILSFVFSGFIFLVAVTSPVLMSSSEENNRILSICALLLFLCGCMTVFMPMMS